MSKLKVKYKDNQIIVNSRLGKTEEINQQELQIMRSKIIRGLMKPSLVGEKKIAYIAPIGITLKKYLANYISINDFFLVFAQILEIVKSVDRNSFNINDLVLNLNYSFINERTKEVHFLYQPIRSLVFSNSLASFLYDVAYGVNLELSADYKNINQLIDYMKSIQVFSIEKVEEFILRVYPQVYKQVKRQKPGQSQMLGGKDVYYHRSEREELRKSFNDNDATSLLEEDFDDATSLLDDFGNDVTSLLIEDEDDATSLLIEDENATSLLIQDSKRYSYLIRTNTFDRIEINKPVFRIGKERSYVDYFVQNNSAVSRLHADIISKGKRYFIKDNNSTNRTFVNGVDIPSEQEVEIFDGDSITLANEMFEFHID